MGVLSQCFSVFGVNRRTQISKVYWQLRIKGSDNLAEQLATARAWINGQYRFYDVLVNGALACCMLCCLTFNSVVGDFMCERCNDSVF